MGNCSIIIGAMILLLSGCSKPSEPKSEEKDTLGALHSAAKRGGDPVPTGSAVNAVAAEKEKQAASVKTTVAFLKALGPKADEWGVKGLKRYTEEDDPNKMLGRDHGYLQKVGFKVAGEDGSFEVFANLEDAEARKAYISKITQASPALGDGYDYLNEKHFALLRLPKAVLPKDAGKWKELLDNL